MYLVFFTFLLLSPRAFAEAPACDALYSRLNTLDPKLADAFGRTKNLDPDLVQGKKTPNWDDFDNLDKILDGIRQGKTSAVNKGQSEELKKILSDLAASTTTDEKLKALGVKGPKLTAQAYQPGEYELKALYQQKLWEIDRELPKELKIPLTHVPFDQRRPELIAQARQLVADDEKSFDKLFATSGFPDEASLQKAIRAQGPEARQALDDLTNENVDLAMRRPQGARWWAPKVGFQNQRVTGNSQGMYAPEMRDGVEARLIGQNPADYAKFDTELKPNYGYLKPSAASKLQRDVSTENYGSDIYVFKKSAVRDRLTWTPGDSLDLHVGLVNPNIPHPSDWTTQVVPWKHRSLLAPQIADSIKHDSGYAAGFENEGFVIPGVKNPVMPPPPPAMPVRARVPRIPEPPAPQWKGGDWNTASEEVKKTYTDSKAAYETSAAYKAYKASSSASEDARVAFEKAMAEYQASPAVQSYVNSAAFKQYQTDQAAYQTAYIDLMMNHSEKLAGLHPHAPLQGTPLAAYKSVVGTGGYVELQFWGPLTFKDVEAFEFEGDPPSGDFLKELISHGVQIRDARGGIPVPWTPPAVAK